MPPKYQQDLGEQLKQYQPLVRRIASRIGSKLPANVMLDDLIQEGMTGLLDALQRYVPQQNQSFEAYASMRIRGAIYDACRKEDILPRNQRDQLDLLEKVTRRLEHTLGRLPTELEIAKEAGVSIDDYFVVIDTFVNVMPIDDVPENLLPTDFSADPLEKVSGQQFLGQVVDILKTLPEKQRLVMALHYQEDLSYREIAAVLDLTPGRISQLHTQAMISIRALLNIELNT
jgi:RNA polymerase sigma factor for flagellar operon FliA